MPKKTAISKESQLVALEASSQATTFLTRNAPGGTRNVTQSLQLSWRGNEKGAKCTRWKNARASQSQILILRRRDSRNPKPYRDPCRINGVFEKMVVHYETYLKNSTVPGEKDVYVVDVQVISSLNRFLALSTTYASANDDFTTAVLLYKTEVRLGICMFWEIGCVDYLAPGRNSAEEYMPEEMRINISRLLDTRL
jgi:hypothetical protein